MARPHRWSRCLDRYAAEGVREVVLDPIGFVCDHVEILYDIDIALPRVCRHAASRGPAESLNVSPAARDSGQSKRSLARTASDGAALQRMECGAATFSGLDPKL